MTHDITNPRFANAEQTAIDCTLTLGGRQLPFTASADDPDERGQEIFFSAVLGLYGAVTPYEAPEPSLEELKAGKWEEVKAERDRRENGSAPTPFGPAQCDDKSKIKLNGLAMMAQIASANGQPFQKGYTLTDNSVLVCDAAMMIALGVAVGSYVDAIFETARQLRAQIEACTSAEQLAAINVQAAPWPAP